MLTSALTVSDQSSFDFDRELSIELKRLMPFAKRFRAKQFDPEDLVSDTAVKALANRDKFVPGSNMRAWLHTILRNIALSKMRKYSKREAETYDDVFAASIPVLPSALDKLILDDALTEVSLLTTDSQLVILKRAIEGYSYEELSDMLGIPIGTIKSRLSRARAALTEAIIANEQIASRNAIRRGF